MVLQLMKANVILSNSQFIVLLRYILSCLRRLKDLLFLHSDGGDVTFFKFGASRLLETAFSDRVYL